MLYPITMKLFKACIFLNSKLDENFLNIKAFNTSSLPSLLSLKNHSYSKIFIADGGIQNCPNFLLRTNQEIIWIGDNDSSKTYDKKLKQINKKFLLNQDKDISDYGAILEYIRKKFFKTCDAFFLEIIGGIGGDVAHEFANIFESAFFIIKLKKPSVIIFHPKYVLLNNSAIQIELKNKTLFSVFSLRFNKKLNLFIKGAKYQGNLILTRPSHGLHNVCKNKNVQIVSKGTCFLVLE